MIDLLRERRNISSGIQRERLAAGGVRTDFAREREIYHRYQEAFGAAGSALGSTVLEICRGRLGAKRLPAAAGHLPHDDGVTETRPLRLGVFSFLNCSTVRWGLDAVGAATAEVVGTPRAIVEALLAGDVDVAPVSLVEFLRHHDELLALPGLAIGSDGPVMSCQLFTRGALADLDGGTVASGSNSRTAALLATILLAEEVGVTVEHRTEPPVLADMLRHADGAVLIGDAALAETLHPRPGLAVHDLGALWRDWVDLPMVFAVWAVRRPVAAHRAADVHTLHTTLLEAVKHGGANLPAVAQASAVRGLFTPDDVTRYLGRLDYALDDRQTAGIRRFAALAARHGEVPHDADIDFFRGGA